MRVWEEDGQTHTQNLRLHQERPIVAAVYQIEIPKQPHTTGMRDNQQTNISNKPDQYTPKIT